MKSILFISTLFFLLQNGLFAQQSGRVYEFLSLPQNARITSLGGLSAPFIESDPGMAILYPSEMDSTMHNHINLGFSDHFGDIHYGNVSYIRDYQDIGTFAAIINYISYGRILEADEFGWATGEFSPIELALGIAWSKRLNENLRIGSQLKFINSSFYNSMSSGLAADISITYKNPEHNFAAAALIRNAGRQITYYHGSKEPLPFDAMIGVSKKLNNAPVRFSLVANNLHRYNLKYETQQSQFETDESRDIEAENRILAFGDNVLRHMTIGVELIPVNNFSLRLGYNHRRRQELAMDSRMSTVGFSWGVGIKTSRFEFQFGRSNFHLASSQNHITIGTNLSQFFNRANTSQNTQVY